MAISKQVKVGGIHYNGYKLVVSSSVGDYVIVMNSTTNGGINSVVVTPDRYGAGDSFSLDSIEGTSSTGTVIKNIAATVYNIGAGISIMMDLAALQDIRKENSLRLTYSNVATTAMNVFVVVERIG